MSFGLLAYGIAPAVCCSSDGQSNGGYRYNRGDGYGANNYLTHCLGVIRTTDRENRKGEAFGIYVVCGAGSFVYSGI